MSSVAKLTFESYKLLTKLSQITKLKHKKYDESFKIRKIFSQKRSLTSNAKCKATIKSQVLFNFLKARA